MESPVQLRAIDCRAAGEMIAALEGLGLGKLEQEQIDKPANSKLRDYQLWLRERLKDSGLGAAIVGGPGLLPYIDSEIPPALTYLFSVLRPRTYGQLAVQVALFLDWYLDQSRPIRLRRLLPNSASIAGLGILAVFSGGYFVSAIVQKYFGMMFNGVLPALLLVYLLTRPKFLLSMHSIETHIHATELQNYLIELFSIPLTEVSD